MTWMLASTEGDSFAGAKTVGQDLYDRDDDLFKRATTYYLAEKTAGWTDAVWVSAGTARRVYVPTYVLTGDLLKVDVLFNGGTGANQHSLRITVTDAGGTTNGTTVLADNSGYAVETLPCTAADDDWADAIVTVEVEVMKNASDSTVEIKCERIGLNLWFEKS